MGQLRMLLVRPSGHDRPVACVVRLTSAVPAPSVSASGSVVHASLFGSVVTSRASTTTQSQFASMSPENLNWSCGAVAAVRSSVLPTRLYDSEFAPAARYCVPLNGSNGAAPGRSQSAALRESA